MPITSDKLCECGCGQRTNLATSIDKKRGILIGQPRRFVRGHQIRVAPRLGDKNPRWKGGPTPIIPSDTFCTCGCGLITAVAKYNRAGYQKGESRKYLRGHHRKRHPVLGLAGGNGSYLLVYQPQHPRASTEGYVGQHVLIAEKALGRFMPDGAIVHHVNRRRDDNRNSNLVICENHAYHMTLHRRQRALDRLAQS